MCCLAENPFCLALCVNCDAEFWSSGRYQRTTPEAGLRNRWDRERVMQSAKEVFRKATETLRRLSGKEKTGIEEDEKEIGKEVGKLVQETVKVEE